MTEGAVEGGEPPPVPSNAAVQAVLNVMSGTAALVRPVRAPDGRRLDWRIDAITRDTGDVGGRTPADMIGRPLLDLYPGLRDSPLLAAYERVLETGVGDEFGPFPYTQQVPGVPKDAQYSLRVNRLGDALLLAWVRLDPDERLAARRARIERLGNIGWAVWSMLDGTVEWSDQMSVILRRHHTDPPLTLAEYGRLIHPEDYPTVQATFEAMVARDAPYDLEYRIVVDGEVVYLKSVGELTRDATGQPIELFTSVQDISTTRQASNRLEVIRRELQAHQHLLAEEHRLAVQLQRIILPVPDAPLTLPGIRVAIRYLPAEKLASVGGDWFQASPLPDGSLLLAVGDVAGHGLAAAATMAQLRHALAGLAMLTAHPGEILSALNTLLYEQAGDVAQLATAFVARFEPGDRRLTWAQAGHPPTLLARTRADVHPLDRPHGLLLGALRRARYAQATTVLDPGDLLLMYTDGLVESPDTTLDQGLAALTRTIRASLATAGDPLTTMIRQLRRTNPDDDTCILAAQLTA